MSTVQISEKQENILKLLEKYGCLDIAQVYALYEPLDRHSIDNMVNMMVSLKLINILDEHVLVLAGVNKFSLTALSCIWAMIHVSSSASDIEKSFQASEPAFSYMVVDNQDSYIFVSVTSVETIKVRAIQEKIERETRKKFKDKFSVKYIFVTTDDAVIDVIKNTDFDDIVYIAILKYDREVKLKRKKPA